MGQVHFQNGSIWYIGVFVIFLKNAIKVDSEEPDQTPRSVPSDLCLHSLPLSRNKDAVTVWVIRSGATHNV